MPGLDTEGTFINPFTGATGGKSVGTHIPFREVIGMNKDKLFQILADPTVSDAEKDDAVIELGESFQDDETVDFLIEVSNDGKHDEMIAGSCGESIGQIWLSTQKISYDKLTHLKGIALTEVLSLIKTHRPDWYETYLEMTSQS